MIFLVLDQCDGCIVAVLWKLITLKYASNYRTVL